MLRRVKYVTPQFFEKQKYKIKAIKVSHRVFDIPIWIPTLHLDDDEDDDDESGT